MRCSRFRSFLLWFLVSDLCYHGVTAYPGTSEGAPKIVNFPEFDLTTLGDVVKGISFTLPCKATGARPLTHQWHLNGGPINTTANTAYQLKQDGSLLVVNPQIGSSPLVFQCVVSNIHGTAFTRKLKVAVTGITRHSSSGSSSVQKVYASFGLPLTIMCPIEHQVSLGANYTWGYVSYKTNHITPFKESEFHAVTSKGTLVIPALTPKAQKFFPSQFRCRVSAGKEQYTSRSLGFSYGRSKTKNRNAVVYKSPELVEQPKNTELALRGGKKELRCIAKGYPIPDISWMSQGRNLKDGVNGYRLKSRNRVLIIEKVDDNVHNTVISCGYRMSKGWKPLASTQLQVVGPPKLTGVPSADMTIGHDKDIRLECKAKQMYVDPTITDVMSVSWYKNNQQLTTRIEGDTQKVDVNAGVLQVFDANDGDSGVYQCVAQDRHGMSTAATRVLVKGITCPVVNPPPFSKFVPSTCHSKSSFRPGESCRVICNLGFDGKGYRDTRTCLRDGGWTSMNYICRDNMPPTIVPGKGCPSNIVAATAIDNDKAAYVTWSPPEAEDNTGKLVTRIHPPSIKGSGHWFKVRGDSNPHVVTYRFTDPGHKQTACSFNVTVIVRTSIINPPSKLLYVLKGKSMMLDCKAHAHDDVTYTWTKASFTDLDKIHKVQTSERVKLLDGGQRLLVKEFSTSDSGKYTCTAKLTSYDIPGNADNFSTSVNIASKVHWSPWGEWSTCSKCDKQGTRTRTRKCLKFKTPRDAVGCEGKERETKTCTLPCPKPTGTGVDVVNIKNKITKIVIRYHGALLQWLLMHYPNVYEYLHSKKGRLLIALVAGGVMIVFILTALFFRKFCSRRRTRDVESGKKSKRERRASEKSKVIKTLTSDERRKSSLKDHLELARSVIMETEENKEKDRKASERRKSIREATANPEYQTSLRKSIQMSRDIILHDEHQYDSVPQETYVDEYGNEYVHVSPHQVEYGQGQEEFVFKEMEGYEDTSGVGQNMGVSGQNGYEYEVMNGGEYEEDYIYEEVG